MPRSNSNPPRRRAAAPVQGGLLGGVLQCPDVAQLPLVIDDRGELEVLAPGHLYQPLLLKPGSGDIEIHPGALEKNERKFVVDLIKRLYPAGNPPLALGAPLKWGDKEIHLRRNLDRDAGSFRLRVDDSDWYYPDFIVWIIDRANRTQTFGFVDPKGLYSAASGGWGDYKVVSTTYMPHVIEQQLKVAGHVIHIDGEQWTFRIRGVLVSVSPFDQLRQEAKFKVSAADSTDAVPNKETFRRGRIVFNEDKDYIDQVLALLTDDNEIDALLQRAAAIFHSGNSPSPRDHRDAYLHIEQRRQPDSDGALAERVLKDLLLCEDFATLKGAATHRASAALAAFIEAEPALVKSINDPITLFPNLLKRLSGTGG